MQTSPAEEIVVAPGGPGDGRARGLLASIEGCWPVTAHERGSGYVPRSLDGTRPLAAWALAGGDPGTPMPVRGQRGQDRRGLRGRMVIVVADDVQENHHVVPVLEEGDGWRAARPGDGVAEALLSAPEATWPDGAGGRVVLRWHHSPPRGFGERAIGVDQTNESVVVEDRVVVKWLLAPDGASTRGVTRREHLDRVGFPEVPRLFGSLTWEPAGGAPLALAVIDEFLPDAIDGWDWCVAGLLAHLEADHRCEAAAGGRCPADFARDLGALTARLHLALAHPSAGHLARSARATRTEVTGWLTAARAALEAAAAIDAPDAPDVRRRVPRMARGIEALRKLRRTPVQAIHGDLHVGQVLRWRGGLAVIDFEGAPAAGTAAPNPAPSAPNPHPEVAPTARDVAQMLVSLDHVALVADRRTGGHHRAALRDWAGASRAAFLAGYVDTAVGAGRESLLDDRLLGPFVIEQLCRELLYAAGHLPRWRYAPMGALRWLFPEGT